MDRSVLEGDPYGVIEGMMIAAYAIGCKFGYVYCRAEYPLAIKRLQKAIDTCYEKGYLGNNCLGLGFQFDMRIKAGAGAYWRGDSKNKMLQRIYGTAWADKKQLKSYLQRLEEAAKRDHRKLGVVDVLV